MRKLYVLFLLLLSAIASQSQTTVISSTGDGGFENGATFAANGWTVVNGATNQWFVGAVATPSAGTNSAYVSDNATGTTYNYLNTAASTVHFYRDVTFPAGETNIVLSFKWKGQGEGNYDYVTVYSMSTALTPTVNSPAGAFQSWLNIPTAYPGALVHASPPNLNLQSAYQTQTICLPSAYAGTTRRLVFMWSNDGSVGTQPPGSIDEISLVTSTPAAPANQPTGLVLTPFSTSQINGSFTAAVGTPDGYLTVRYVSGGSPTNPVNGTIYVAGNTLGTGTIVSSGATTSFNATGLTPTTTYDFYIYSFNNAPCSGGPLYRTVSPLFGTQSTLSCSPIAAGTYTVGPTGTYSSLTAALAAVSVGTTGPVILELQPTYTSAGETFPITFPSAVCPTGTLTVRPSVGAVGLSITSANATGTINFDGGDNVTIDGRAGGAGPSQLTISNTSLTGYAIQLINSASSNTIKYCTVAGVNTGSTSGVIFFNNAVGLPTGNSNNTIDNCDIRDGVTTPTNLIYCSGNTVDYVSGNINNTVSNCNIHDWFNATSTTLSAAINIVGGASDWTISGNSFYQSVSRTFTMVTATDQGAILISSATFGTNFTITNNFIGGSAPLCGGAAWTYTGGATGTPTARMISLTAAPVATFNTISGNTIQNIAITSVTTSQLSGLISHVSGNANITNNTLGSQTATGSVTFTYASTVAGRFFLPLAFGLGASPCNVNVNNNNIGGITATTSSTGSVSFRVLYTQAVAGSQITVNNNLIGGTVANSIQQLTNNIFTGILALNPTVGAVYTNNTVRNLTLNNTGTTGSIRGIDVQNALGGGHTITGNTIFNLTTNGTNVAINNAASIVGITLTANGVGGANVSGNTIYNLTNTNTTVAGWISGMYFATAPSLPNTIISKNFIHSINLASTLNTAGMAGIFLPNTGFAQVSNNMVRLGIDASGGSITNGLQINGIYKASSATMSIYHNSVYIGGTGVATGTASTYAFRRSTSGATQDTLMNNIFYNARSNASGTGKHYAIFTNAATVLFSNYNDLLANGTGGVLGINVATDYATLAAWRTATNQDWNSVSGDPQYVNPTGTSATVDLHIGAGATPVEQAGYNLTTVTDDYDAQARAGLTPVDLGADAGNFTVSDIAPPVIYLTPLLINTCSTGDRALNGINITDATGVPTAGALRPRIYYRKGAGAWFSQPGTLASGSATNGIWDFTIVAADMGGLVAADVVSYYIIAQDIVATPNIASNFGGAVATDVNTVTTHPTTPNTFTINGASLSGTYTVGAAGTYTTLTAAVAAYNSACLTGPVIFSLTDAAYAGETFPITINANPYASSVNTLTIKPTQAATTITGTSATGLIVLNAADWVIIDGSTSATVNTVCPAVAASRNLTLTQTNAATTSAVIWLQSTALFDGATNNTIKNINLVGNSNTTTFVGVGSGSTTISTASLGFGNHNNSYINNNISKTQYGIFSQGSSLGFKNQGTIINQNLVNTVSPNNTARGGIVTGFENGITISGNNISEIALTSSPDVFGIAMGGIAISTTTFTGNEVTNATVTKNVIGSVRNTGTFSAAGIFVAPALSGTNLIANNMLSGVSANGTAGDFSVGMLIGGGTGITQIYYNSITMTSVPANTGASVGSYALAIGGANPVVDIRNNILVNTQNNGTGNNYAIGYGYVSFTNLTSNNNDYYTTTGATFFIGATSSLSAPTNQSTVANLQATTFKDGAAQNVLPVFVSPSNLHLVTTSPANLPLNSAAVTVSVTDDIDCDTRAGTPDIGADEYIPVCGGAVGGTATGSITFCNSGTPTITATGYSVGVGSTYQWQSSNDNFVSNIVDIAGQTNPATLTTGVVSSTTYYRLKVTCALGLATDYSNIVTVTVNTPPAVTDPGSLSLCAGSTATFSVTASGLSPYTYQWQEDAGSGFLDISGATSSSLSFITLATQNGYKYRCVVTNTCGSTTSNFATLTVSANPVATIAYDQTLYASDSASNLYKVNITNGAFTFVGNFDGALIGSTDIEYDYNTGRAFSQGRDGTFGVYEFNINTGGYIGPVFPDGGSHTGLEYAGTTLYGTVIFAQNGPSQLHTLNPLTGVSTNIGATGVGPISGLAFNVNSGVMYGMGSGPGIGNLYTINLATGAATLIGSTGIHAGSLQFGPDGRLYAGGSGANRGNMYIINTTTGVATLLGPTGLSSGVSGLTLANTPAVFCSSSGTLPVVRNGSPGGTYTSSPAGLSLNASTGDITAGSSAAGAYTVTYTIPPVGVCASYTTIAPVTIVPTPVVTFVPNQTVCNGSLTTAVNFTGGAAGTVYNWTNNNTSIGLAASGSGNIAAFTAINTGASPVTATIVVTPVYTSSGLACTGPTRTFFITVNPSPTVTINGGNVNVCPGATVNLTTTATPGVTYSWVRTLVAGVPGTPAGTTPGISVTQSGIYTVTVLAGTGCTGTASTAVTVADYIFNGSITNTDASQTDRLTLDGTGSTCAVPKVCPGTTVAGAINYDTYSITNPQSTAVCATIGLRSNCSQNVFSAVYLGSYNPASLCTNYLGDAGVSAASTFYEVTIPANGTIVIVVNEVTSGAGCGTYTLSVGVPRAAAAITTSPSTTVCTGTPVTLTASPANTYLWSPGGATTQSIVVSPVATTTYSVTLGYGNSGCTASASQVITINTPPTLTVPVNRTICSGQNTTFSVTASGAGPFTYQWQIDQGSGFVNLANVAPFSNVTTATLDITAASVVYSSNIFRCLVTGACGTTTSGTAILTVNPTPTITVAPSGLCAPVVLTAQGNSNTYSWSPATGLSSTTGAVVTANPTATTTYTVTGTITATGCQNSATATVLGTPPAPVITPSTATICAGSIQQLTASSSTTFAGGPVLIPAGAPGTTSGPGSPYPSVISVSGLPASGVTVRSVTINGVVHTFPADIDLLLQSPTGTNVVLMSDVGGGVDNTGQNYTFDDAGPLMSFVALNPSGTYRPSNNGATDTWIAPGPGAITQATPAISSFAGDPNGTWNLYLVDDAGGDIGSISSWSITFNVNTAVWTPVTGLFTDPAGTIPYVAGTALNTVYFTQSPLVTTNYTITATNTLGTCSSAPATATITVNPRPTIAVGPSNQCGPVILTATGNSDTYSWSPAAGLSATTGATVTANPTVTTLYTVTGRLTATGCTNSATVNVFATPAAPVISPANVNICAGAITQLTATATPAAVWTPVTGLFTDVTATIPYVAGTPLNTVYAKPAATTTYSVTSTLGTCTSVATNVTVTVTSPITITTQPASQTVCQGSTVTFSVVNTGNLQSYQWQVKVGAAAFTNIAGANNASLILPAVTTTLSGNQYQVIITNSCNTVTSSAATLTVNPLPVVTTGSLASRICISDTLVPLVGSPVGGSWTGIGVSGFNFIPAATAVGTYTLTYRYTNTFGCAATATVVAKVEDCQERFRLLSNNALILFPNPNIGRFNIRINSTLYSYLGMRVFTSTGQLVKTQFFNGLVYGRVIPIDMMNLPTGVYMVKFYYDAGNRTSEKTFKVIVGEH